MRKGLYITTMLAAILTAKLGRITFNEHPETFYNLRMSRICQRAAENGIEGNYWERPDGCKMYGPYVIVATDWGIYPYGSLVETSRGVGIALDHHTAKDKSTVDIATNW